MSRGTGWWVLVLGLACGTQDYEVGHATDGDDTGETTDDLIDTSCSPSCADTEICVAGSCMCRLGLERCDGECVDTKSSQEHCGECNAACQSEVCSDGQCRRACEGTLCDGTCSDLEDDPFNCGACGKACAPDEFCDEAQCLGYTLPNCAVCPCDACPEEGRCCETELENHPVACVQSNECP